MTATEFNRWRKSMTQLEELESVLKWTKFTSDRHAQGQEEMKTRKSTTRLDDFEIVLANVRALAAIYGATKHHHDYIRELNQEIAKLKARKPRGGRAWGCTVT